MSNMDSANQKDSNSQNSSLIEQFISDSQVFSFVHKKLEKLVSALYMVTDFMDLNEPIRTKLRVSGTELLTYLSRTYAEGEREKKAALRYALNELSSIVSLCEVARSTGAVSQMNFSILKDEFLHLIDMIESKFVGLTSSQSVSKMVALEFSKAHIQVPANSASNSLEANKTNYTANFQKDTNVLKKHVPAEKSEVMSDTGARQEKITSFIRKNGPSSIKDIASVIVGCSEKTVQRDLASLISQGKLVKRGERRWSMYSIAN